MLIRSEELWDALLTSLAYRHILLPAYHRVRLQPPNRDISCLVSDSVTERPAIRKRGVTYSMRT